VCFNIADMYLPQWSRFCTEWAVPQEIGPGQSGIESFL